MHLRPKARWLVLSVLVGGCVFVCMVVSQYFLRRQARFVQAPSVAQGRVTTNTRASARHVFYSFEAGGQTWNGDFEPGLDAGDYSEGRSLPVFYLAADPRLHSVKSPGVDDLSDIKTQCVVVSGFVVLFAAVCAHRWLTKLPREPFCLDTREFPGSWAN